ncbi:hypothetical protein J2Y60_002286 [Arcicella sp. BE140]|nr:hypothetical protein [Arcicella sp. BE51]MDR6812087.1 hypothetical protein [Arcicella sp. BE140]MDR6823398.1 hypothetical protein [Arcicella sp. BE139]
MVCKSEYYEYLIFCKKTDLFILLVKQISRCIDYVEFDGRGIDVNTK